MEVLKNLEMPSKVRKLYVLYRYISATLIPKDKKDRSIKVTSEEGVIKLQWI